MAIIDLGHVSSWLVFAIVAALISLVIVVHANRTVQRDLPALITETEEQDGILYQPALLDLSSSVSHATERLIERLAEEVAAADGRKLVTKADAETALRELRRQNPVIDLIWQETEC